MGGGAAGVPGEAPVCLEAESSPVISRGSAQGCAFAGHAELLVKANTVVPAPREARGNQELSCWFPALLWGPRGRRGGQGMAKRSLPVAAREPSCPVERWVDAAAAHVRVPLAIPQVKPLG